MSLTPEQRRQRASLGGRKSWENTTDRSGRTSPAREARWKRYLAKAADLNPGASAEQVEQAAEELRRDDMRRMALASVQSRQAKAAAQAEPIHSMADVWAFCSRIDRFANVGTAKGPAKFDREVRP